MVRTAINILSPIAALAIVVVSLQSFVLTTGDSGPAEPLVDPATTALAPAVIPELSSVSRVLATTSDVTLAGGEPDAVVPDAVRRLLIARGAVLLVPERNTAGGGL